MRYPELRAEYVGYARHGLDMLAGPLWDQQEGGFFFGLDETGKIKESYGAEKHVYGIAFGIYGSAAAYEATKDQRALELAKRAFNGWIGTPTMGSMAATTKR